MGNLRMCTPPDPRYQARGAVWRTKQSNLLRGRRLKTHQPLSSLKMQRWRERFYKIAFRHRGVGSGFFQSPRFLLFIRNSRPAIPTHKHKGEV